MSDRDRAEEERVESEQAREVAEDKRVVQEETREAAEGGGRAAAEEGREVAEDERVEAGEDQQTAEDERVVAEDERVVAGKGRQAAEVRRVTAETAREVAEDARVAADEGRLAEYVDRLERSHSRLRVLTYVLYVFIVGMVLAFTLWLSDQNEQIVEQGREGCERLNVVRTNQGEGIGEQVAQTRATLASPNGLGTLEPFRAQILEQQKQREARIKKIIDSVGDHPRKGHPFEVDCDAAYPL